VGELLATSNSLGELVPSELLRHGLLASVEPSAAAVAEICGVEVGRRGLMPAPATSSVITSHGSQLWLNWARGEALVDYGIHVQDTVLDERALLILVDDAPEAYEYETGDESAMHQRVLVVHSYGADNGATSGQHSGFVEAMEQAGAAASCRRTLFWWTDDQLSSTHALTERMALFTAEYIRRFQPHVTFVSGDLALQHLAHGCVRRVWHANEPGALPAFLPIAGTVTAAPDPGSSAAAWHPCRATHFIASGIQADPKVCVCVCVCMRDVKESTPVCVCVCVCVCVVGGRIQHARISDLRRMRGSSHGSSSLTLHLHSRAGSFFSASLNFTLLALWALPGDLRRADDGRRRDRPSALRAEQPNQHRRLRSG